MKPLLVSAALLAFSTAPQAAEPVTVANYVRAESDTMIRATMKMTGIPIGSFTHLREPTTPENQPVIRMNQDTLYSATVLDLSMPMTITLPVSLQGGVGFWIESPTNGPDGFRFCFQANFCAATVVWADSVVNFGSDTVNVASETVRCRARMS